MIRTGGDVQIMSWEIVTIKREKYRDNFDFCVNVFTEEKFR